MRKAISRRVIVASLLIVLLIAYGIYLGLQNKNDFNESAVGRLACGARGGKVQPVCMSGQSACVRPYSDGGKSCSTSSECSGGCYVDFERDCGNFRCYQSGPPAVGAAASGVCRRNDSPCGEFARIENGVVVETFVAD